MTTRARQSALTLTIALLVLAILLVAAARSQPERALPRIETETAPALVATRRQPPPDLRAARDRWLFHQWVTAVLEQRADFLRAALELHRHPFLVCTRAHESSPTPPWHDDGYDAVSPNGLWYGAYQFARRTWDNTAHHAGFPHLAGQNPATATMFDQDRMALHLFEWQGTDPWNGRCA